MTAIRFSNVRSIASTTMAIAIVVLAMDLTFENLMAVIYKTLGNLGR